MIDHASGLSHDDLGEQTTVNYSYCEEPQRKCSGTWYQFKDEGHDKVITGHFVVRNTDFGLINFQFKTLKHLFRFNWALEIPAWSTGVFIFSNN